MDLLDLELTYKVASHKLRKKNSYIPVNTVSTIECISTQIFNKKGIIYIVYSYFTVLSSAESMM